MAVPARSDRQHMAFSPTQYRMFRYRAAGQFVPGSRPVSGKQFRDVPLAMQR